MEFGSSFRKSIVGPHGDPEAFGSISVSENETVAAAAEPTATSAAETERSIEELYAEYLQSLDDFLIPLLGPQRPSSRRDPPPPPPTMQRPPDLEHPDKPALGEGLKVAHFKYDADWGASFKFSIGSLTTSITFAAFFQITTQHLDFLTLLYPEVCHNLFSLALASKASDNAWDREEMTDECLVRFARACPKLYAIALPGTVGIMDAALIAFCENCPNLRYLEVYGESHKWNGHDSRVINALSEHPDWAPDLFVLTMTSDPEQKKPTKAMQALTRTRECLTIRLLFPACEMDEEWPHEEVAFDEHTYRKGRRVRDYIPRCWAKYFVTGVKGIE
ncbi:hypothetical protein CSOJ01_08672 [Colletotrichum sojae]|uniref:Uncharacterized protein n=1 Tax=Colletotrichum sojae TaxID=2175907 RepID=A0A8H6MSI9_9PEZI|nr:hypothetical protein CSOJ01_08672 [Colletotrichum sojae]